MKKSLKKVIAVVLSVTIVMSLFSLPMSSFAYTDTYNDNSAFERKLLEVRDGAINWIIGAVNCFYPCKWEKASEYVSKNSNEGTGEFTETPSEKWYLGYSNASIQTGDELDGKHYVGGSISASKLATEIFDDQKVRTVAMSTGDEIVVFSAVDCFGLADNYVREIRSRLSDFAKENNIVSINVSSLHQHSCVDTFGMNGNIFKILFLNWIYNLIGIKLHSGINDAYMENLMDTAVETVKKAVADMKPGKLYYGSADISKYIRDKRDPQVFDPNMNRFRFAPDDGSKETWIANAPIHCVGNGAAGTQITGDYPYYMEKAVNDAGANLFYVLGAELAISSEYNSFEDELGESADKLDSLAVFGNKLAQALISIDKESETEVEPVLNIAHKDIYVPITNQLLLLAGRAGMLTHNVIRYNLTGTKASIATEIGYMELGSKYAIALTPGELAAEIAFGGCYGADESWDGSDWTHGSMQDKVGDRKLIVFGITNDQIGYILADNDYVALFAENEEFISAGKNTGSQIITEFNSLVDSVK